VGKRKSRANLPRKGDVPLFEKIDAEEAKFDFESDSDIELQNHKHESKVLTQATLIPENFYFISYKEKV
jgi:hypothetical protein